MKILRSFATRSGLVFNYSVPVPANIPADRLLHVNGIHLDPGVTKRRDLVHTVAHEVAHIVRGDHKHHGGRRTVKYKAEKAADDLAERWGFKRSYTKKMLEKLKSLKQAFDKACLPL